MMTEDQFDIERFASAIDRFKENRKETHPIDTIFLDKIWNVYFELNRGCANENEQKQAAELLKKYSNVINMLAEANNFNESIIFDKDTKKYTYRGNEYDALYKCIFKETRREFGRSENQQKNYPIDL